MVGTSENLQQENLESYWKAVGPSSGPILLKSEDSYPNCLKEGERKRKEG